MTDQKENQNTQAEDNENFEEIMEEIDNQNEEESFQKDDREEEISALKDSLARTSADFENFRRRTQENTHKERISYTSKAVLALLPSVDTLKRIIELTPEEQRNVELYKGLESLYSNFLKELESLKIKPFSSKGEKVNPAKHDVMTQAPGEKDVIIEEFETGYMIGDEVLRPAKVVVGLGD